MFTLSYLSIEDAFSREDYSALKLIPASQKSEVEALFAKLAKRCFKRLKCDPPRLDYIASGTYRHIWNAYDDEGRRVTKSRDLPGLWVKLSGDAPKIAGWTLAARLQRLATGERMLRVAPGVDAIPDRFRETGYICEHCNQQRARKDCFVVLSEAGDFKQVGASCLKDFLGHEPLKFISFFGGWGSMCNEWNDVGNASAFNLPNCDDTLEVLQYACAAIRVHGWVSTKAADATGSPATRVWVTHCIRPTSEYDFKVRAQLRLTDADKNLADQTLAWVHCQNVSSDNDYMYNLTRALAHDIIDPRTFGVAVSAPSAYLRAMSREQELKRKKEESANSNWRGNAGERLRDISVIVETVRPMESDFGSMVMVKFRAADNGDLFTWFTSRFDVRPGTTVSLTGTVKRHSEYRDMKETHLSRCSYHATKKKAA